MDSLVNGRPADSISVYDRGLAYGDGLFETFAVRGGEPLLYNAHMERLRAGCARLGIAEPDSELCRDEMTRLVAGRTGVLKLIITRGQGGRGYAAAEDMPPNRLLLFSKWEASPDRFYSEGVHVGICCTRVPEQGQLAGIKHLNRLDNVLASRELAGQGVQEGLMLDQADRIVECTRSNIFFINDGQLHTPDLRRCGVSGVMRGHILQCARDRGMQSFIRDISLEEAERMEEAFVCNSLIGIWPIARLGDRIRYRLDMVSTIRSWTAEFSLGPAHD